MQRISMGEAERDLARLVDATRRGPVVIEREGRPAAVVLSYEEFSKIEALDDAYWGRRAEAVDSEEDYLAAEESETALRDLLGEKA